MVFVGGTRVPFLERWPGKIKRGRISDHLLCLTDVMASLAGLVDQPLPKWAGEDSFDQLSVWLDEDAPPARDTMITQSYTGIFSIGRDRKAAGCEQARRFQDTTGLSLRYNESAQQYSHFVMNLRTVTSVGELRQAETIVSVIDACGAACVGGRCIIEYLDD